VINGGKYINNEFNDVYLVTLVDPIPLDAFTLQVRMNLPGNAYSVFVFTCFFEMRLSIQDILSEV